LPCSDHKQYPSFPRIEGGVLAGSIKPFHKHYIVLGCGNPDLWPAKIEKSSDSHLNIAKQLSILAKENKFTFNGQRVMITASDIPRIGNAPEASDILILPDNVVILDIPWNAKEEDLVQRLNGNGEPWNKKHTILICGHTKRDKRCGWAGKMLSEEFAKQLPADESVCIAQVSHVGGHKWAGNVLAYPKGDWYGRVRTCDVQLIVKSLENEKSVRELWRGRIGLEPAIAVEEEKE
jgi:(2Fe-2S) ferredoxin